MIAALANTEFLLTHASPLNEPVAIFGLVGGGIILIALVAYIIVSIIKQKTLNALVLFVGCVFLMLLPMITVGVAAEKTHNTNRANWVENIKTVYNVEEVIFDSTDNSNSPLKFTVLSGGKAYKVLLRENKDTYEPSLYSYDNEGIDMNMLKRDAQ
jgi:hypothetical protein